MVGNRPNRWQLGVGQLQSKAQPGLLEARSSQLGGGPDGGAEVQIRGGRHLGVLAAEGVQRAGEPLQTLDLLSERVEHFRRRAHHAVAHRLQVAPQVGEGSSQLVREVADQLRALALLLLQRLRHLVEGVRQRGQLGRTRPR